jgi:hypothetical protein
MTIISTLAVWAIVSLSVVGAVVVLNRLTIWVKGVVKRIKNFNFQCEMPDLDDVQP